MDNKLLELDWNLPIEVQEEAISRIALTKDLNLNKLLRPGYGEKKYWENAAKVLFKIGYPRVKEVIPGLLEWMQDINWPGALIVMEILTEIPKDIFIPYLERAVIEALNTNDEIWIEYLSYFLEKFNLKEEDFCNKEIYEALVIGSDFWK